MVRGRSALDHRAGILGGGDGGEHERHREHNEDRASAHRGQANRRVGYRRPMRWVLAAAVSAGVLAGCGIGDSTKSTTTSAPPPTTTTTTTARTPTVPTVTTTA